MTTPDRITKAKTLFSGPYNCSQAVAAAFSDILNKDEDEIFRLMSGFGFGMGGERSVCGAVTGGIFVISSTIENPEQREELYDKVFYLINQFKVKNNGKLNCLDLVGENPTSQEFNNICPILIEQVAGIVSKILEHRA
jgi:C_GCAxxG_C_C family probable redox protein